METCGTIFVSEDNGEFLLQCFYCNYEVDIADWTDFMNHIRQTHMCSEFHKVQYGCIGKDECNIKQMPDNIDVLSVTEDIKSNSLIQELDNISSLKSETKTSLSDVSELELEKIFDIGEDIYDLELRIDEKIESLPSKISESEHASDEDVDHAKMFKPTFKFMPSRQNPHTLSFIEFYKALPCLWDNEHKDHNNEEAQAAALKSLLNRMQTELNINITEAALKAAIKHLHSQYFRAVKLVKSKSGTVQKFYLQLYDICQFLARSKQMTDKHYYTNVCTIQLNFTEIETNTSNFIDVYAAYPQLYDPKHKDYIFMNARKLAYKAMVHDLSMPNTVITEDDIYKAIYNLRSWYTKTTKRLGPKLENATPAEIYYIGKCSFLPDRSLRLRIPCELCARNYYSDLALQTHMYKTHEIGELPFKCTECERRFDNRADMLVHQKRAHLTKTHKCNYCKKSFATNNDLKLHIRTHTGEKPFVCESCGKGFRSKFQLNYHLTAIHTKVRAYKCTLCPKDFYKKRNLDDHIKSHMNIRDKKCETCGKGFTNCHSLIRHRKIHTKNKSEFI